MTTDDLRPINARDLDRVEAVIEALYCALYDPECLSPGAALAAYEQYQGHDPGTDVHDDQTFARELGHARRVAEALRLNAKLGRPARVRDHTTTTRRVCAVFGCATPALFWFCPSHELTGGREPTS